MSIDQQDKFVSVKIAALPVKFKMETETFEEIANAYEKSIEGLQINILTNRLRMSLVVQQKLMEQKTY